MRIASLHAENVHGYLPLNIDFFDDLTFLTGLNGSGKTTTLRLLMALLRPNLEELGTIVYEAASVSVVDNGTEIRVSAKRTRDGVRLRSSNHDGVLDLCKSDLELLHEAKRREEPRTTIIQKYFAHPVFQAIQHLSTPMFLGLDRRFYIPQWGTDDITDARRREYVMRRHWVEDPSLRHSGANAGLMDVNVLVLARMQEIRAEQEKLDEHLRAQFFKKAFEYNPSYAVGRPTRMPSRSELNKYKGVLAGIERAAEGANIPVPEIRAALTDFLERMSHVVDSLHKTVEDHKTRSKREKKAERSAHDGPLVDHDFFEWIINKPQADRIVEHLKLLEEYIDKRNSLRDPINRFLLLVNEFFQQTKKEVSFDANSQLVVRVEGDAQKRSISALSSGERQLLVMLAHLSLNPSLAGSGVFIVDEPELSLHIDWQEKFVDAIREANPNVQLILATHSPAIILDRVDSCFSLS